MHILIQPTLSEMKWKEMKYLLIMKLGQLSVRGQKVQNIQLNKKIEVKLIIQNIRQPLNKKKYAYCLVSKDMIVRQN